jgi:hypothetical protein
MARAVQCTPFCYHFDLLPLIFVAYIKCAHSVDVWLCSCGYEENELIAFYEEISLKILFFIIIVIRIPTTTDYCTQFPYNLLAIA